jgi:hypothetical protein
MKLLLNEIIPKGFMATQEKKYGMAKRPSSYVYYVEALDGEIQKTK